MSEVRLPKACEGCPLADTAQGFCPPQPVEAHTQLVVWGEAPGKTEGLTGYGFTGASGRLLRKWLKLAGLSVASGWPDDMPGHKKEDVAFRNTVLCVRPGNVFPNDEEARECLRRHGTVSGLSGMPTPILHKASTDVCTLFAKSAPPWIAYGANATRTLTGCSLPILKTRGSFLPVKEDLRRAPSAGSKAVGSVAWIVSSLHPAFLVGGGGKDNPDEKEGKAQDSLTPLLGLDARRATECSDPRIPTYTWVKVPGAGGRRPPSGAIVSVDIEGANGQPNIVGVSWEDPSAEATYETYVFPWSDDARRWLDDLFASDIIPCFHNASYDVAELKLAGVTPPKQYYDTINMAALYDPDQPMNLQTQVLSHVSGSVAWKGLINHEKGPDYEGGTVSDYRELWTRVLRSLGRPAPSTGSEWYAFYNSLDVAWGLALAISLKRKLTSQKRWSYYTEVMLPLQRPLLDMGNRGMLVDEACVARHKRRCKRRVAAATKILERAGSAMLEEKANEMLDNIHELEVERDRCKALKEPFHHAKELTSLRNKLKTAMKPFNPDSSTQRSALLYSYYGLPPIKNKGAKGLTTDDTAVEDLSNRLRRGTAKPKRVTVKEALLTLRAMSYAKKYATLERTFLQPELR